MQGKSRSSNAFERVLIVYDVIMTLKLIRFLLQDLLLCHRSGIKILLAHY